MLNINDNGNRELLFYFMYNKETKTHDINHIESSCIDYRHLNKHNRYTFNNRVVKKQNICKVRIKVNSFKDFYLKTNIISMYIKLNCSPFNQINYMSNIIEDLFD